MTKRYLTMFPVFVISGFIGLRCEIDLDDCVGIRCENGGHCVDGPNSWSCRCKQGFTGRRCETRLPAPNSGSAVTSAFENSSTTLAIPCKDGNSCLHDGQCIRSSEGEQGAFCECPLKWHGKFCEIPVCPQDFCANGGVCREILLHPGNDSIPSQKEPYCECPAGYFGDQCTMKVW